jgi:hypothetical protein
MTESVFQPRFEPLSFRIHVRSITTLNVLCTICLDMRHFWRTFIWNHPRQRGNISTSISVLGIWLSVLPLSSLSLSTLNIIALSHPSHEQPSNLRCEQPSSLTAGMHVSDKSTLQLPLAVTAQHIHTSNSAYYFLQKTKYKQNKTWFPSCPKHQVIFQLIIYIAVSVAQSV